MTTPFHHDSSLVFIDGPLTLYIKEKPEQEILDAYTRLGRLVTVAARQLQNRISARGAMPEPTDDRGGSPRGEGS